MKKSIMRASITSCLFCLCASGDGEHPELIKIAEKGDAEAQYQLGMRYYNGTEAGFVAYSKDGGYAVAPNYAEAVKWFEKAAKQGHIAAQYEFGACYLHYRGVKRDVDKAIEWLTKSAEKGYSSAQIELAEHYETFGIFHEYGTYEVDANQERRVKAKAFEWYKKAAEQNDVRGQYGLGNCYVLGKGVDKDENTGYEWIRKAAEQGHSGGQYSLGSRYENGIGIDNSVDICAIV
jgi:TPR repeat protein